MSRRRVARPIVAAVATGSLAQPVLARQPAPQAASARACDTGAMNAEPTAACTAAPTPATSWATEAAALDRALVTTACTTGDPAARTATAVRMARLAGPIEARTDHAAAASAWHLNHHKENRDDHHHPPHPADRRRRHRRRACRGA